jgi:hypothetical protein
MKERITEEVEVIDELRHHMMENLPKRLQECTEKQGRQLVDAIFKTNNY